MTKVKKYKIVLAGGGTGGHIYPLLAVAEELRGVFEKNGYLLELHFVGTPGKFEDEIKAAGIKIHKILAGKFRRYLSFGYLIDIPKIFIGLIQAFLKIYAIMPDEVFSKGGPGAFQTVLAAKFYMIPVMIHESDAYPGLTNLLSARFAKKIAISFPNVAKYFNPAKTILTGNPLRPSLLRQRLESGAAKEALGFSSASPLVLILGGSQGSERVNDFIISVLKNVIIDAQILHQTGAANYELVQKAAQATLVDVAVSAEAKNRYKAVSFLVGKEMAYALSAADVVIGRAGSGTIFEIAAFGKPSILIPLPEAAGDHQRENAYAYAQTGAAYVTEESNFSPNILLSGIKRLTGGGDLPKAMAEAALKFAKPQAAEAIAAEVFKLA
ncbi:MAG: UDP-N-acetylglucosamine--N-acetylmuramyl-(pentapeptide) pyrophosphoryl-undecaprenol N-acetylglucosamine transferase [Parcubacteria group bacterium LiPW_15]|nr:MAG: UDP-N-acetylglucosamine--N-acetylmuramyl-(pentapeptide) pyrophosphoryl-undecaprenol N-acetylglucosamine transferase [Parcubacteria group bacterium LiPW_15]